MIRFKNAGLSLLILSLSAPAFAASGAAFLKIGAGARAAGMGSAFTAAADDASAVYWNPSGLSSLTRRQALFMHSQWLAGMNHEYAGFVQPTRVGALGIGVTLLDQGRYEGRDESRAPSGDFSAADLAVSAAFSRRITGSSSLGGAFKIINQEIASEKAAGFAFDLGWRRQTPGSPLALGFSLLNLGPSLKFAEESYDLPLSMTAGASWRVGSSLLLSADVRRLVHSDQTEMSAGAEYWVFDALALRTGYLSQIGALAGSAASSKASGLDGLSGLGAGIGLRIYRYQLDYALVPQGELGQTHRISLTAGF